MINSSLKKWLYLERLLNPALVVSFSSHSHNVSQQKATVAFQLLKTLGSSLISFSYVHIQLISTSCWPYLQNTSWIEWLLLASTTTTKVHVQLATKGLGNPWPVPPPPFPLLLSHRGLLPPFESTVTKLFPWPGAPPIHMAHFLILFPVQMLSYYISLSDLSIK